MPTFAEGLSAVSTALTIFKTLIDVDRSTNEAEFKLKVAEATSKLADAKLALTEGEENLANLKKEAERLTAALKKRDEEMVRHKGLLYRANDKGQAIGSPCCEVCETDGFFITLRKRYEKGMPFICPRCNGNFGNVTEYGENR